MIAAIIGIGCSIASYWLCYLQGPLLTSLAAAWNTPPEMHCLCVLASTSLTSLLLAEWLKLPSLLGRNGLLSVFTAILLLAPLTTAGLAGFYPEWGPFFGAYLPAFCGGTAQAVIFVAWLERIGTYQLRQASMIVALAYAFAGILAIWGQTASYFSLLVVVTLLPLLSLILLLRPVPPALLFTQPYPVGNKIHILPPQLIITLALLYTNGGILVHLLMAEDSYLTLFHRSYLTYIVFCPTVGFLLYRNESLDLRWIYRLLLPMSLIGFIIFCFQRDSVTPHAFALLQGASALLNLYFWLLIPYFSRFSHRPAAVCAYGLLVSSLCVFIGIFATDQFIIPLLGAYGSQGLSFIACIISALLIFLFPGEKETFAGWHASFTLSSPAAETDSASAKEMPNCELPASCHNFGLSFREQEVLSLLAKGRSGPYISEALNISTNTVKTHIRNIYGKLAVRNRQELLSLLQSDIEIN